MHWGKYEVFSIVSGLLCLVMALIVRDTTTGNRIWLFVGGVFMIGYGFYVAQQTSGVYYFSVWIFALPLLAVAATFKARRESSKKRAPDDL